MLSVCLVHAVIDDHAAGDIEACGEPQLIGGDHLGPEAVAMDLSKDGGYAICLVGVKRHGAGDVPLHRLFYLKSVLFQARAAYHKEGRPEPADEIEDVSPVYRKMALFIRFQAPRRQVAGLFLRGALCPCVYEQGWTPGFS